MLSAVKDANEKLQETLDTQGDQFKAADFDRLMGVLRGIKGRFILSINDHSRSREHAASFDIEEVKLSYSVGIKGRDTRRCELIISNMDRK